MPSPFTLWMQCVCGYVGKHGSSSRGTHDGAASTKRTICCGDKVSLHGAVCEYMDHARCLAALTPGRHATNVPPRPSGSSAWRVRVRTYRVRARERATRTRHAPPAHAPAQGMLAPAHAQDSVCWWGEKVSAYLEVAIRVQQHVRRFLCRKKGARVRAGARVVPGKCNMQARPTPGHTRRLYAVCSYAQGVALIPISLEIPRFSNLSTILVGRSAGLERERKGGKGGTEIKE